MTLHHKIRIDKVLFAPLAGLMSAVSVIKRSVFSGRAPAVIKRMAVVKLTGMGSIVQSTPMLLTLKKNFPEAELIFITSKSNAELIRLMPMVSETWIVNDSGFVSLFTSCLKLFGKFFSRRIDFWFDLEVYSYFSAVLASCSRARVKLGLHRPSSSWRAGIYHRYIQYNSRIPVSEVYLQMTRAVHATDEVHELYRFSMQGTGGTHRNPPSGLPAGEYIVVNPNASDLRRERRWGATRFSALINQLALQFPQLHFVITGSANEADNANEVVRHAGKEVLPRIINSCGKLTLWELIQTISAAKLMVTNDSGPMHLAFAVRTPVVALFGPCSPLQYKMNDRSHVIYKNLYCSPCVHWFLKSPCNGDNQCMKMIEVDEVSAACARALSGEGVQATASGSEVKFLSPQNTVLGLIRR
jgi:ADP-heptose:LPS heptosyltransferase